MNTACGGGAMYTACGGGAYVIQQCIQHGSVHSMWGVGQHHISNDKLMETQSDAMLDGYINNSLD